MGLLLAPTQPRNVQCSAEASCTKGRQRGSDINVTVKMRGAEANLQALFQSSMQSSGNSSGMSSRLLPFSCFFQAHGEGHSERPSFRHPHSEERRGESGCTVQESTVNLPCTVGIGSAFTVSNQCRDLTIEQIEKDRIRQIKAAQRKERNKAAARRSNLNKKLIRDQLEKKSVELWEENLQLHQDIRNLSNRLRHFRHMRKAMRHVCQAPVTWTACH